MEKTKERETLELFLNKPVTSSRSVMWEFSQLDGAITCIPRRSGGFVYVPGNRNDRVLLVARADTVWDKMFNYYSFRKQRPVYKNGRYVNSTGETGIGVNNRAGCAILYLLKDLGHSLLVLDSQEFGFRLGSYTLRSRYYKLFSEMNRHRYALEFDLKGSGNLKYYDLPVTDSFKGYIADNTGFNEIQSAGHFSTDICELCESMCGVNVSAGYYNENTPRERLDYGQWLNTVTKFRDLLEGDQPEFCL